MAVLINFKICDNSKDCNGIEVCPTGAFHWDEKKNKIAVDNKKCVACGKCEDSCPVGAIRVAKNKSELIRIKREIQKDPRRVSDLFMDRYGADSISPAFLIPLAKFDIQILQSTKLATVEFFTQSSIQCLLYSIPIRDLFKNIDIKYRKIKIEENDPILKKYRIKKLPALVFFKNGKVIGKVEGHYEISKKKMLLGEINKIID